MLMKSNHPFHMVDMSPWPLMTSFSVTFVMVGALGYLNFKSKVLLYLAFIFLLMAVYLWWKDVTLEANYQGLHPKKVTQGIKLGMILFITSEVLFFMSFFWAFFHFTLSPNMEIGACWPPLGMQTFNFYEVPLLNTLILLTSGLTVTWSHKLMLNNNMSGEILTLTITVLLGGYFTFLQAVEYLDSTYCFYDSSFGSSFFLATGFHGLHVIIGSIFLFTVLLRSFKMNFSSHHHLGFEAAAWYWHFVDVVWLFLFFSIYWWATN